MRVIPSNALIHPPPVDTSKVVLQQVREALAEPTCTVQWNTDNWWPEFDVAGYEVEYHPNYTITIKVGGGAGITRDERIPKSAALPPEEEGKS